MPDLFTCRGIIFAIGITLLKDLAVCQPLLTGSMSLICPRQNEPVTLTCMDRQVATLIWRVKPHDVRFSYTANEEEGKVKIVGGNFTAILVDISNKSISNTGETVADLTSTLTTLTMAITNGTIITCETLYSLQKPGTKTTSSITLILAEEPVPTVTALEAGSSVLKKNLTHFLATLFNGTFIDYYNISFRGSDEVILNTSGTLPHLPWLHNITSFNATAHNCAGQSAPVVVYISHATKFDVHNDNFAVIRVIHIVAGTAGVIFITIVVVVASILICICVQRSKQKCHKPINVLENIRPMPGEDGRPDVLPESSSSVSINHMPQSGIDLTNNPAYEVCQQRTHLSHMRYLSAQEPEYNMDSNSLYVMVNAQK